MQEPVIPNETMTKATTPTASTLTPHPAIVLDPATPALSSMPSPQQAQVPISSLPISTSTSTLGSIIVDDDDQGHDDNIGASRRPSHDSTFAGTRRASRPFGGPGFVDIDTRASARNTPTSTQRRARSGSNASARKSKSIPPAIPQSLGELPSLPPHAASQLQSRTPSPSSRARRRRHSDSTDSVDLTPVLDVDNSFRITSGIFGESMSQNLWLSSVLDTAFDRQQTRTNSSIRTDSRLGVRTHRDADAAGPGLSMSASMDSIGRRCSSSRIPVSRSQQQYLAEGPTAGIASGMRTMPSGSDISTASHHLSTRPSHGALSEQNTAPTSVASSDSLSAAAAFEAQVFRADLAQKLPATTMRASRVFPRRQGAALVAEEVVTEPSQTSTSASVSAASESPTSSRTASPERRRKSKKRWENSTGSAISAGKQQAPRHSDAFLAAPSASSITGLKSVSDTDLHRGESAKVMMMHASSSNASLATAPFSTPFHRSIVPDEPMPSATDSPQTLQASKQSFAPIPSPVLAQLASTTTPKMSPKASFASQWRSKLARSVTLHASPQLEASGPLSYVKSSSQLNLPLPTAASPLASPSRRESSSHEQSHTSDVSPDVSSSVSRQEEWHINTEDSNDDFMPIFVPCRSGGNFRQREVLRPSSGLGIGGVDELPQGGTSSSSQQDRSVQSHAAPPSPSIIHSPASKSTTSPHHLRQQSRHKTSPIMQSGRWATADQRSALPPSPSLYEDDGKSFVSGHRGHVGPAQLDGASIFDFEALNTTGDMSPRGAMSPLEQLHKGFSQLPSGHQTTPVMNANSGDGRFAGVSPSALSPYSALQARHTGRPTSRAVTTMHQVEDGVTKGSRLSDFSCHASPRSMFDAATNSTCMSLGMTEDVQHELTTSMSAVAARAKLLQSVQEEESREQDRRARELIEHQRRAEEAERGANAGPDDNGVDDKCMAIIEEESDDSPAADSSNVTVRQSSTTVSLQAKKPVGLSIYVGNAGGSLGDDIVSPLTPPFTPAKAALYSSRPSQRPRGGESAAASHGKTSPTSSHHNSQESQDTVPDLGGSSSSLAGNSSSGPAGSGTGSPFKLRPLSLSASNSVLGEGFDLKSPRASPSMHGGTAVAVGASGTPTKRIAAYRSSRQYVAAGSGSHVNSIAMSSSDSNASLTSSAVHAGMYAHLTSALGLDGVGTGASGSASKRGSFVYKSAAGVR